MGTWSNGLNCLDPVSGRVAHYRSGPDKEHSLLSDNLRTLYFENDSILWIGCRDGLSRMNIKRATFTHYTNDTGDPHSLSYNLVWSVLKDRSGDIWVGTNAGLNKFDQETGQFERFFEKDGLPDNAVYGLIEDNEGTLWVCTKSGLAKRLNANTHKRFQSLVTPDGRRNLTLLPKAHFLDKQSGLLYFGTEDGFFTLDPTLIRKSSDPFQPTIHEVAYFNTDSPNSTPTSHYFMTERDNSIELTHEDKIIEITLADLHWNIHSVYKYEYRLAHFNQQWIEIGEDMKLTFTNLAPGQHPMLVRRTDLDQEATPAVAVLTITVLPPWWKTWWARLLGLMLTAGLTLWAYRFQLRRQLQKQETDNLRALHAFKDELYSNITHEFRNPLMLINGWIDRIKGYDKETSLIKRNSLNLLKLVNEILDLRKIESGKLKLKPVHADVVQFIQYLYDSFQVMAEEKGVTLHLVCIEGALWMDFDQEKLLQVVSNLLSNAIKFTPEGGQVYLILEKNDTPGSASGTCVLRVSDTGIGIPKEVQRHLFDRFYQVEDISGQKFYKYAFPKGFGVGLALTRDLITLMKGNITVESIPQKGSTFTVHLPISQKSDKLSEQSESAFKQLIRDRIELKMSRDPGTASPAEPTKGVREKRRRQFPADHRRQPRCAILFVQPAGIAVLPYLCRRWRAGN